MENLFMHAFALCILVSCSAIFAQYDLINNTVFDCLVQAPHGSNYIQVAQDIHDEFYNATQEKLTQTEAHLIRYADTKIPTLKSKFIGGGHNVLEQFISNPELNHVVHKIIEIERREAQLGRYTLVHGQYWFLQFFEDLYTHLFKTLTNIIPKDFFFLRFKNLKFNGADAFKRKLRKNRKVRRNLIKKGTPGYYAHYGNTKQNRNYLLFTNYALFNNKFGSSSARYIAKGDAENGVSTHLNEQVVFEKFGLDNYYSSFAYDLAILKNKHDQLVTNGHRKFGHPVVISFEAKMLSKVAYISWTGQRVPFHISYVKKTYSVKEALETLRTNPYSLQYISAAKGYSTTLDGDHNEFSVVLSLDGTLKPNNGIYLFSIPPVSDAKWQAYCAERDTLFARITQAIEEQTYGEICTDYWQGLIDAWYSNDFSLWEQIQDFFNI